MGDYRLSDLIDLGIIQKMSDAHYMAAGVPIGIIDAITGSVLVKSGWQDICINFHRANPVSRQRCRESDDYIKSRLVEGEACRYRCKNGLWHIGMPIVVAGRHLATMFLGQFFYAEEIPEQDFFLRQALESGFDVEGYLAALKRVPVFSREKVERILDYNKALVTFISDLADRSRLKIEADLMILEKERKFHAIFDQTYQFLGLLSVDGRLLEANRTALDFLGIEAAAVIGKFFWETPWWSHSPELQDEIRLMVQRASKGEFIRFEATHRAPNGNHHHIDFSLKPVTDETGAVVLLIPEGRDITQRKKAEEELQKVSRLQSLILDNSTVGIAFVRNRVFEWVNPTLCELFRLPMEQLQGASTRIIYPDDEAYRRLGTEAYPLLAQGKKAAIELEMRRGDGSSFWCRLEGNALDAGRCSEGSIWIWEDITERKRAEEEKLRLESQLLQAQKMEAIGTLAGGVAHDFNNILTAITGYASLSRLRTDEGSPVRVYIDDILAASERAANLVHSLLAFSRKQVISPRPVDINTTVRKIDKLLLRLIGEDIELRTTLCDRDLIVMADSTQIEQVLMNLATNARDAMPGGGLLSITTKLMDCCGDAVGHPGQPETYAVISVSDTGEGMSEETRQRIFEPFFTTKEMGKGTGLGLSIVYGIVKQHNGEIKVYSEPGKGTTFRIYLRILPSEAERVEAARIAPSIGGTETILVAEDDPEVRKFLRTVLEGFGYTVIEAVDGEDAVRKFIENRGEIELFLFDVVMPRKNGRDAYEQIRMLKGDVIRAIFLSGYTADIIHKKGLIEEGITLISKPLTPHHLLAKVREVLAK